MAYIELRERAQALRRNGWGIKEIARKLGASQSSVSAWSRDIFLSQKQQNRLLNKSKTEGQKALFRLAEIARKKRVEIVMNQKILGEKDVKKLSKRDLFIAGLALYWGEGYKKGNEELGFTNNDPRVIKFIMKWLIEIYDVSILDFIFRISMNEVYENSIAHVTRKWARILRVDQAQFTKPSIIHVRAQKTYSTIGDYLGTLRIKVRRGTNLRRRIMGSIDALASFC